MKSTALPFPVSDDNSQVIPLPLMPHVTGEEFMAALFSYDQCVSHNPVYLQTTFDMSDHHDMEVASNYIHGLDQLLPAPLVQIPTPASSLTMECQCHLGPGCALPLEGTTASISYHLHLHNHVHKQFESVYCPWAGCDDEMLWRNVSRHVKEKHLGVKVQCEKCGKRYTRKESLTAHRQKCLSRCVLL
ncbi:hypothetical protein M404DRAFT_1005586 [Pisolithus tinctorius Marx 270]|uniref:C2H2-type domain-containing protein n=1 Tax=Pisolithus tinctorius Marx 270 TaxID=870435 RepID=A0A0C3NRA6_PISTI|nr:hypothetical protein M404DRAFT_1005586 [Pisolithus tinctorius Marx 270]